MTTTIKQIKDSNGVSHELDSKYWGGKETLKTINGEELFGEGNIDISVSESNSIIEVIYEDLCELRNSLSLIPGQKYRITDYVTTTVQENTESAGHQFDIIVTANSSNTLSEIASACIHEGDTYFGENNANLSAWQIWYCLDNDADRFEWAMGYFYDSDNNLYEFNKWVTAVGKAYEEKIDTFYGVEVNEKFSHFGYTENLDGVSTLTLYGRNLDGDIDEGLDTTQLYHYKGVFTVDGKEYDGWAQLVIGEDGIVRYATFGDGGSIYVLTERIVVNNGKGDIIKSGTGVIYRMIDEWGNDCPYDFKNIKFLNNKDENFYYTFCRYDGGDIKDFSICGNNYKVYNNVIKPYYVNDKQSLNRILFANIFGGGCYSNIFGENCHSNIFGDGCYSNIFGVGCHSNTFGLDCHSNIFGTNCYSNEFVNDCHSNIFGTNCHSNKFGNYCNYNTFGNGCFENKFTVSEDEYSNLDYVSNMYFADLCSNINLYYPDSNGVIKNYNINKGVSDKTILVEFENSEICVEVWLSSSGEVVQEYLNERITNTDIDLIWDRYFASGV